MGRGQVQLPFAWLFAIIVGAVILFLTIFAVTKITNTQQLALDATTAKEIGVLLNPLETGFESARTTSITLPSETRIYNRCNNNGYFGRQIIKLSQKSFGKWTDTDIEVGFSNKYIFSDYSVEGRSFYLFSKPFEFPFKVSDVIYLTSKDINYCFIDAGEFQEEIENLNLDNIYFEECPSGSVEVCFRGDCEITVNPGGKYVEKKGERMYFSNDALMYAAIFSEKGVYECQLGRLMQRGSQLSQLYLEKSNLVSNKECLPNLDSELLSLVSFENNFNLSNSIIYGADIAKTLGSKNEISSCRLW